MDVAIIDYRMGNLHSVQAACAKVGLSSEITDDKAMIMDAKAAILPGVGAFGEAMAHLSHSGLDECIYRFIETGKPFVGICLGLQLLFEQSVEFGSYQGLGLIKGSVTKFRFNQDGKTRYPVPQVGWNRVMQSDKSWKDSFLCDNHSGQFMYFVHSYYVQPEDDTVVLAKAKYGDVEYCSAVKRDNLFATQFHPEKSGPVGMRIYQQLKNSLKSN
jgi:imidazole glycerol-phosphate synthase subunit HisH